MSDPANLYFRVVRRVTESIALYPVLIPALYVVVAILVFAFESTDTAATLRDELPPGLIDADNSREVLGTLITGIISLVVFSFSMVMVVLNGAASRLSPRVLPGLISDRRNQVILGIYLGSIVYYLLLITSINTMRPAKRSGARPAAGCAVRDVLHGFVRRVHSLGFAIDSGRLGSQPALQRRVGQSRQAQAAHCPDR